MSKAKMSLAACLLALLLVATGCTGPADGSGATVIEKDPPAASEQHDTADDSPVDEEEVQPGMRETPLPVGSTALIGDWEIKVVSVDTDADEEVAKANEFNSPAPDGSRFVLVNLEGTYTGDESGTLWADITYKILGSKGNTFDTFDVFIVSPNPIADAGEAFPGATVAGDFVVAVPVDQIEGGAIILEEGWGGSRTFFALQ